MDHTRGVGSPKQVLGVDSSNTQNYGVRPSGDGGRGSPEYFSILRSAKRYFMNFRYVLWKSERHKFGIFYAIDESTGMRQPPPPPSSSFSSVLEELQIPPWLRPWAIRWINFQQVIWLYLNIAKYNWLTFAFANPFVESIYKHRATFWSDQTPCIRIILTWFSVARIITTYLTSRNLEHSWRRKRYKDINDRLIQYKWNFFGR